MKTTVALTVCWLAGNSSALKAQDTITVEMDKAHIIIYTKDREGLMQLKRLDLNQIIRDVIGDVDTLPAETLAQDDVIKIYEYELDTESDKLKLVEVAPDSSRTLSDKPYTPNHRNRSRVFWNVDLGFNNYLENGRFPEGGTPSYRLRPLGSRYVAVGVQQRTSLGGANSPLSFQAGLELSWYNFMFENDSYILKAETALEFRDFEEDFSRSLQKSKLTVSYLNLPIIWNLRLSNQAGRRTFNLGLGGYIGYRLGSHSKVKVDGDADRETDSFFLNDWRYGLEFQTGYRNLLLFVKYDLNPLFSDGRGPKLHPITFGIRI
ncbi:MAG: PorT family protein [Bacteroidia bacterium]|nr:PorT family protein [Bacteroidia bacterium]